jgi:hypothetical protein
VDVVHFSGFGKSGPISSIYEQRFSAWEEELVPDIQKAIDWNEHGFVFRGKRYERPFILMFLHECGRCTRCVIRRDSVAFMETDSEDGEHWKTIGYPDHSQACDHDFARHKCVPGPEASEAGHS